MKDRNFSLWAVSDNLNEKNLQSWYGEEKPVYGFLKADGGKFRWFRARTVQGGCFILLLL